MGTRNHIWARRQTTGGPIEKLLLLHIADAISEHARDPVLETSLGNLAGYCEATLFQVHHALDRLAARGLVIIEWPPFHLSDNALRLKIPFPTT